MGERERKGWRLRDGGREGEQQGMTRRIIVHKYEIIKTLKPLKIKQQKTGTVRKMAYKHPRNLHGGTIKLNLKARTKTLNKFSKEVCCHGDT